MSGYLHHLLAPQLLLGAIGTIAVLSRVFQENKAYRLFEHVFIGLALGYGVEITWTEVLRPQFWDPLVGGPLVGGQWAWIMTVPIGLMFYGIYTRRFEWMSRLLFGVFFGLAAGTVFQDFCNAFIPQVIKSFKPLVPPPPVPGDHFPRLHEVSFVLNNLLFMAILFCVVLYFLFAFEQRNRFVTGSAKTGRWVIMLAFGAIFGSTIMTRMALLIDRMYFLFVEWLRLAPK